MNKIIIVDDHSLFREGIKLLIENENLGEVIAEAENGQIFLNLLNKHNPDLVIMDIEMPVMGGLEATQKALKINPYLKILVLTMQNEKSNNQDLIHAGVLGMVLKTSGKNEFEKAIKAITTGKSYFSADLMHLIIATTTTQSQPVSKKMETINENLTVREKEVLQYFCEGLTASEIAAQLFLSVKTIEAHRSALLKKTHSRNTINLVLYGVKNKLVEL